MQTIRVIGEVDDQHRLVASVPPSIPPGSIEVLLLAPADGDDEVGQHWMQLIAREWHEELSDPSQDIYTLADGIHAGRVA
jgi:hypothetical protein